MRARTCGGLWILLCLWAGSALATDPGWRQQALDAVRAGTAHTEAAVSAGATPAGNWAVQGSLYVGGEVVAHEATLGHTLDAAARRLGARIAAHAEPQALREGRLFLTVRGPGTDGQLVEFEGKALHVVGDVTVVESVDRERVLATVREQREYLLRQIHPTYHAFFKVYSARRDRKQERLRVTYTASALWTLLQMRDLEPDPRIDALVEPAANFLLSMQVAEGPHAGSFHYSIDSRTGIKRDRFVVGTTSKTIFTLLDLHRRTGQARYLASARRAGDWLLTRVQADGRVIPDTTRSSTTGEWRTYTKQSVLYSAETLSALSQLTQVTGERKYRRAATRIARVLVAQGEASGWVYGDDYRQPNTISTSWVAMALLDYTRIDRDPRMSRALFTIAHQVRSRQITKTPRLLDDGRYFDIWATSGNGWMNEVLVPVYARCVAERRERCEQFRAAINRTTRWLIQNTYSPENSYHIPNPERARGGAIRNDEVEQVRTDAVCHAANSLIGLLQLPAAP
jgi:hypothetical protein